MQKFTLSTFNLVDRIVGASKHCIILNDQQYGTIYITNKLFNKIMHNPSIEFVVEVIPAHESADGIKSYPESKWISAFQPSRF